MKAKNRKKLILSLIKDDLTNSKLLEGLNAIGLEAQNYCLNLSDTVFDLMGFDESKQSEAVYEQYILHSKKMLEKVSIETTALDTVSEELYAFLQKQKFMLSLPK